MSAIPAERQKNKEINIMEIRLKDVKVGEQFTIVNNKYTKLNEDGYCLLDEYGKDVPNWSKFQPFDSKDDYSNNFEESTIKEV